MKSFEIIADFDGTLTKKGEGCLTTFDVLRESLDEDTQALSNEMYKKYAPLEFDFSLQKEERDKYMREWWEKEFEITVQGGLTKEQIFTAGTSESLVFRDGVRELFLFAKENTIPLMLFTAGLADIIDVKLKKEGLFFENVTVVGNRFIFDEAGVAIDYIKPVVFVGNKHLVAQAMDGKVHADTVFLFGDHPTDAEMCYDANHEKVFRFGFLNEKDASDGSYSRYGYHYFEKSSNLYDAFTAIKNEVENS